MSCRDETATVVAPLPSAAALHLMGAECGGGGAVNGGAEAAAAREESPPRKRARLDDVPALRRRLLDHKLQRLTALRDKFTEQLSELYFLQAGGNMMDYAAWRKRPAAPALAAFVDARRPAPVTAPPPQDDLVDKAKQEAWVAGRVAALARAGLWAERRLPRVLEPPRPKAHWDYLLEEMAWLAQDFAHERKWKKQAAKKCARAVQKYFQDKAVAAQKAEKAQELQLKKIAAFAAKEIRMFWSNVEKLVEWKRVRRVERARKAALDEQLSYIVDRTEKYSRALAAGLAAPAPSSPRSDRDPSRAASDDEQPAPPRSPPSDYGPDEDSEDDEATIDEQERAERPEERDAELAALRGEAELDLDELRRRLALAPAPIDSDDDSDEDEDSDEDTESDASDASDASQRLEALVDGGGGGSAADAEDGERRVEAAASLAATLQPTGTTLAETAVGVGVPRLLRHSLREYQHVGLHWLATMHVRKLNGILADEMGLGKTIQTIALLAHLAADLGDWGPHLVVAPTSLLLNWEMEFKKWCPSFKILTYYGTIKERKLKRVGWTKPNSFHVCITSYKLVVQDHQSFRRKKWKYLILDEAQNIKNFKSQRWQILLNFQTERRLLLTGTPLQNSLLELWSLMHFLMPDVFASHSEFREWFNPVAGLAERGEAGGGEADALVRRLHGVLRPFLLRRLKADVERQLPRKYEHVLMCRLAKRQRYLYDDFMARAKTKETLASGNLLSVINVLMQLRKVCNHPDLFEPRPVTSPLLLEALRWSAPALALAAGCAERAAAAARLGGDLAALELAGAGAFAAHRARHLAPPRRLVEELARAPATAPPRPPPAALRLHMRLVPRASRALPAPPSLGPAPPPPPAPPVPPPPTGAAARLEARRRACLTRLAAVNERRCWRLPLYGADLRSALVCAHPPVPHKDLDQLLEELFPIIDRFTICWERVVAPTSMPQVGAGAGAWRQGQRAGAAAARRAAAALVPLHACAVRQRVAFPHPRLLQYDCGKLQTLDRLLRRLKPGGHRVLIFTQMTRVLDVLEAFLSLHGHAYLRLDGATRVDRRQALVDRFNGDARVFAFILSTRSGGVGLNLTGADCVVFYDSDWNPTMDAQAQDRCHRIGQTRDVHVFRLVTAATVEENILRKADQKRALGHLAIEGGNFTTSYLRSASIKELFGTEEAGAALAAGGGGDLEVALAAAEDEADAAAARAARAETQRELAEFDDEPPPDDDDDRQRAAGDPHADQLMKQLTPIEKYAMRLVESSEAATEAERAALDEMGRQLREWERARAALRAEPPAPPRPDTPAPELTYSRRDARAQVRSRRRRASPAPAPAPAPAPPGSGRTPAPRTRSRGTVHINLWTLDDGSAPPPPARRRPLRNGTLDHWLAPENNK